MSGAPNPEIVPNLEEPMTPLPARARRQADKLRDFALELEIPDDTASNIYAAEMRKGAALLDELAERRHP
jgi:hypothetical protein